MAQAPVVFACANPVPEIWPWEAKEAGAAVVATGRGDFPNQVNNSICFPGLFRGALDVRARTVSDEMCFAAADAIAGFEAEKLSAERIVPSMEDWKLFVDVAVAVGLECRRQGLARIDRSAQELEAMAAETIGSSRKVTATLMENGTIPPPPADLTGGN